MFLTSAAKPSDSSRVLPLADRTSGVKTPVVPATMSSATVVVCEKAATTVSVIGGTAAAIAAAPFCAGLVAVGIRDSFDGSVLAGSVLAGGVLAAHSGVPGDRC